MKIEEFKQKYDVILYFCNIETNGSDSAARITWPGHRGTVPQMIHDVPTMMVSIDNPLPPDRRPPHPHLHQRLYLPRISSLRR